MSFGQIYDCYLYSLILLLKSQRRLSIYFNLIFMTIKYNTSNYNIKVLKDNYRQMAHVHGPNCGCAEYVGAQNADDLYGAIDTDKVRCLNQQVANSGKKVFKEYEQRFDKTNIVSSDCDGQLLLIVPFNSQVKIRAVCVIAKSENRFPNKMKLYVNDQNIDFSLVQSPPVQQFILGPNLDGNISNAVKASKFQSVHKLIIHLSNEQEQVIDVAYIQIKGENTKIKRQAVETVYQVRPNAEKKDIKDLEKNPFQMG